MDGKPKQVSFSITRPQNSQPHWIMSKQLQLRLQYARLKVENGWQKQTLNEVENLFFHQLQAREAAAAQEAKKAAVLASLNTSSVPLPKTLPPDAAARSRADEIYRRHSEAGVASSIPLTRVSPPLQGGAVAGGQSTSGMGQTVLAPPFGAPQSSSQKQSQNQTSPNTPPHSF